jgi:hypothetical protein
VHKLLQQLNSLELDLQDARSFSEDIHMFDLNEEEATLLRLAKEEISHAKLLVNKIRLTAKERGKEASF